MCSRHGERIGSPATTPTCAASGQSAPQRAPRTIVAGASPDGGTSSPMLRRGFGSAASGNRWSMSAADFGTSSGADPLPEPTPGVPGPDPLPPPDPEPPGEPDPDPAPRPI